MPSERCEQLPTPLPAVGTLFLAPPLNHSQTKIRVVVEELGLEIVDTSGPLLAVAVDADTLRALGDRLTEVLTGRELSDTRALLVAQGEPVELASLVRVDSLDALVARTRGEWLLRQVADGYVRMLFQPLVWRQDPEQVFGYECLFRVASQGGMLLQPAGILDVARRADLLYFLDRALRLAAIECAAEQVAEGHVLINFNPAAIYDPEFCLRSTVTAVERYGIAPERVIFEVVESDRVRDADHLRRTVDFFREAGFKVALDDFGAGVGSVNLLAAVRPDMVKLDRELINGVHRDPFRAALVCGLLETIGQLGITTVAEGVEDVADWHWLQGEAVDLVQGFLFGRPASPPPRPLVP